MSAARMHSLSFPFYPPFPLLLLAVTHDRKRVHQQRINGSWDWYASRIDLVGFNFNGIMGSFPLHYASQTPLFSAVEM